MLSVPGEAAAVLKPPTSRQAAAEARREQILEAALALFADKGFAAATMRDIARAVGVTEGLLYHYFGSKDELLTACCEKFSWTAELERIVNQSGDRPVQDVVREIIYTFMMWLHENGAIVRMSCAESLHDDEVAAFHRGRIEKNLEAVFSYLRMKQEQGLVRRDICPFTATSLMLGSAHSQFLFFGKESFEEWTGRAQAYAEQSARLLAGGLSAQ